MAGYVPNYQKKNRLFAKRERELVHALRNRFSIRKIDLAAEKLRMAKIAVFKSRFARGTALQPHTFSPEEMAARDEQVRKWLSMSTADIIDRYRLEVSQDGGDLRASTQPFSAFNRDGQGADGRDRALPRAS